MVAVGKRVAPLPPRRSRLALLTHRAPPSGRTSDGERFGGAHRLARESTVQLWKPFIAPSIKALEDKNRATERSLGIIKPDPDSLKFKYRPTTQGNKNDQEIAEAVHQVSMLEDPLKPLERAKYSFVYQYTCDGHPHRHQIHDWEVQTTFINYRKRYGSEEEALKMMTQEYQDYIPKRNLHFILGTMARHLRTFIVIGLLRSQYDPRELDKQGGLF
ncbi:MAG: hypothetical protein OES46_19045 [Gammaproteobacteria bacterium]|nr:hypothetical protein [Gammaproteobacteria bacterium]